MEDTRIPVWLDCDPGHDRPGCRQRVTGSGLEDRREGDRSIDGEGSNPGVVDGGDTFAILLAAYHPAIRILGVSTVFGNASLE
ncbi:hypothetical protein VTK26DRAFT_1351 [Humicola hyalothermophila]